MTFRALNCRYMPTIQIHTQAGAYMDECENKILLEDMDKLNNREQMVVDELREIFRFFPLRDIERNIKNIKESRII